MVVRLVGSVNGQAIIFEHIAGDIWAADIPGKLNGTYIVEMTAYDDAGNAAYISQYLLAYDPANLCVRLIPFIYEAALEGDVYGAQLMDDDCSISIDDLYVAKIVSDDYYSDTTAIRCEVM